MNLFNALGSFTNIQCFNNTTVQSITIDINTNEGLQYCQKLHPAGSCEIKVRREKIGTARGYVKLYYESGAVVEYEFGISAKNCRDTVDVYESHVIYNGKKRGSQTGTPALIPVKANAFPSIPSAQIPTNIDALTAQVPANVGIPMVQHEDLSNDKLRSLLEERRIPASVIAKLTRAEMIKMLE